ncbi:unnamed protein product, partial [Coregonus sp. 'balchen']
VDILHWLGLTGSRETLSPGTSSSSLPSPSSSTPGAGVLLSPDSHIEAATGGLFPPELGEEFSVVVSLSSWRANNAFLFSVRDGRDKLQFGIQLLPRKVVVYTGEKASVYFTYDVHDGRQHSFAVGVRPRSVSFHADCGAVQQREQTLTRSQGLGSGSRGLLTLGRIKSKAAQFQGFICQLDIYPSAQASARYCHYLKKQCWLADTFRSPPPPPSSDMESGLNWGSGPRPRASCWSTSPLSIPPQQAPLAHPQALSEGLRNSSSFRPRDSQPQPTNHLLDNQLRPNSTTLYRENQVDTSEEHGQEGAYDVGMEGYDYGYEEPDYFYRDYDEAFPGPKGDPGP